MNNDYVFIADYGCNIIEFGSSVTLFRFIQLKILLYGSDSAFFLPYLFSVCKCPPLFL
jgi:hypothetical protein